MKGDNLKDEHHVVRVVPFGKLRRDEHNTILGVDYTAFLRRENEDGLSVTALEYFAATRADQIIAAVHALRASAFKPSPKSGFAIGNVKAIRDACTARIHKIRIIHAPTDDTAADCEIRQMPREDIELLELLAASTWAELHLNKDIAPGATPAPPQPAINPWP